ncbi:lipoyl(octanoyl) transferase LipB [Allofranklinella schreckenbergeri]|uniref:Octanoyltransferase n=1 Tax=Allofranklinella schreckenbergeri TaxID=1076744 RepID=A0A3M6QT66_9BURK|nr:lipoyl(octanoyl) transferase LipB [Allofranklinella schreckenbergeri]RMX06224.1 lipoyl(octanoyl) transferase LipB [Allofranklinella schreckenbergeri]
MKIRHLGLADYQRTVAAMQAWSQARHAHTEDELWLCQHPSVYTLGTAGDARHILGTNAIPVVQSTRGGQVTYHGPGQVVAYPLLDLRRRGLFVRDYVTRLEAAVIETLRTFGLQGQRVAGAPGVYVALATASPTLPPSQAEPDADKAAPSFAGLAKIAALGIKVSRGCAYHGLALNVAMDLQPYQRINPCGYAHLTTCDMRSLGVNADWHAVAACLADRIQAQLAP